jgi:hypothetical protein
MQQSIDDKSGGIYDRSAADRIARAGALGQMPIRAGRIDERLPSPATRHRDNTISLICQLLSHYLPDRLSVNGRGRHPPGSALRSQSAGPWPLLAWPRAGDACHYPATLLRIYLKMSQIQG